jgi:hypothetical protein
MVVLCIFNSVSHHPFRWYGITFKMNEFRWMKLVSWASLGNHVKSLLGVICFILFTYFINFAAFNWYVSIWNSEVKFCIERLISFLVLWHSWWCDSVGKSIMKCPLRIALWVLSIVAFQIMLRADHQYVPLWEHWDPFVSWWWTFCRCIALCQTWCFKCFVFTWVYKQAKH